METIKVHVTEEERNILVLLVNRRYFDLLNGAPSDDRALELFRLYRLKVELEQAGT